MRRPWIPHRDKGFNALPEPRVGLELMLKSGERLLIGDADESGVNGGCGCCADNIDSHSPIIAYRRVYRLVVHRKNK